MKLPTAIAGQTICLQTFLQLAWDVYAPAPALRICEGAIPGHVLAADIDQGQHMVLGFENGKVMLLLLLVVLLLLLLLLLWIVRRGGSL